MKHGVTVGKFMPFHKGHEMMIDLAASILDTVTVIVSGTANDEIPVRERWLRVSHHYRNRSKVFVVIHHNDIPECEQDENGTATEDWFWDRWIDVFKYFAPNATHFVSGDAYGKVAAKKLGIEWLPAERWNGISGTMIRQCPLLHYNNISDSFKSYYAMKIAIVGPESSGKTTLTNEIAFNLIGQPVMEYGRTVSESKENDMVEADFYNIVKGQQFLIGNAIKENAYVVSDTEAFTTYLFGKYYLDMDLKFIKEFARMQQFDLYVLLKPTLEWKDDGTRVVSTQSGRDWFFDEMKAFLKESGKNYIVVDPTDKGVLDTIFESEIFSKNRLQGQAV